MVTSFLDAATDDTAFMPQPLFGQAHSTTQFAEIGAAHISQLHSLQVVPDAFIRVQVWRIAGQSLQMDPFSTTIGQEVLDRLASVNGRAIPDHQQLAGDVTQQVLQKANHIRATESPLLYHQQQGAVHGDIADGRYVVSGERHSQDRGLTAGSVGAYHTGQQIEARFVYPDYGPSLFFRPLFSSGQRSAYQAAIAASSLWVARRMGFCTLQPISFRSRQT